MTRTRMLLVLAAAGIVTILAGVITSLVIAGRAHGDTKRHLRAADSASATAFFGSHRIKTSTPIELGATPMSIPSIFGSDTYYLEFPTTLMFCEPLREPTGDLVATLDANSDAEVLYGRNGCEPDVDESGNILVRDADGSTVRKPIAYASVSSLGREVSRESIIWTPAKGMLNGAEVTTTARYLRRDASVVFNALNRPVLNFNMTEDGQQVFGSMSERLIGSPLAMFIDGQPIRGEEGQILAPTINGRITESGQSTGLSEFEAERIAQLINLGLAQ